MKKIKLMLFLFLTSLCLLTNCKKKTINPFDIYNNTGNYHVEFKMEITVNGSTRVREQNGDEYIQFEPLVQYVVSDGVLGKQKNYGTEDYWYTYNYDLSRWERRKNDNNLDNNGFTGWRDINNYDYYSDDQYGPYGYYKLKETIDIGQSDYYIIYLNEDKKLVIKEKAIFPNEVYVYTKVYVETNIKDLNLQLPSVVYDM